MSGPGPGWRARLCRSMSVEGRRELIGNLNFGDQKR